MSKNVLSLINHNECIDEANIVEHFMKEFGRGTEMDGPLVTQWTLVMNFLIALLGEGYYEERGPRGRHGRSSSTYLGLPACLPGWLHSFKLRCQQNDSLAKRRDLQNGLWPLDHARAV